MVFEGRQMTNVKNYDTKNHTFTEFPGKGFTRPQGTMCSRQKRMGIYVKKKFNGRVTGRSNATRCAGHVCFWADQVSRETLYEVQRNGDGKSRCTFPGNFSCVISRYSSFPGNLIRSSTERWQKAIQVSRETFCDIYVFERKISKKNLNRAKPCCK